MLKIRQARIVAKPGDMEGKRIDLDGMEYLDYIALRNEIADYEGKMDISVTIERKDQTESKVVNLLTLIDFFFPSQV
jgi:hypothetical protein